MGSLGRTGVHGQPGDSHYRGECCHCRQDESQQQPDILQCEWQELGRRKHAVQRAGGSAGSDEVSFTGERKAPPSTPAATCLSSGLLSHVPVMHI